MRLNLLSISASGLDGIYREDDLPEDHLPEVFDILTLRIVDDAEIPLTRPEHALLGMHFGNLCRFNHDWTTEHQENIFPQGNEFVWWDAFGSYLRFNEPAMPTFKILRNEFQYAIATLMTLSAKNDNRGRLVNRLGQHLFTYYLWEVYPLVGDDESLLERFYVKTNDDRARWG